MKRHTARFAAAVQLAPAAPATVTRASVLLIVIALAGCGGTRAPASNPAGPHQPSTTTYLDQVSRIDHAVGDERSRFFNVAHSRADVLRGAARLGHELTAAAARLQALQPPDRLVRQHRELLHNYTATGTRVTRELARSHPRAPRLTGWLLNESDADGRLIGDMYAAG
ncbi:MAG: hypothetical protein QOE28_3028 [Solirubrobacteraceae bacterium]|jgi:hypothetical protein|nr:hypothetical protein [Solirubrobacteraceae bacterium]